MSFVLGGQGMHDHESGTFLIPLQGFSPVVKFLSVVCVTPSSPRVFDLVLSFPLLEDLAVTNYGYAATDEYDGSDWLPTIIQPSNPPVFTGSLKLAITGLTPIARWLSSLPGGIHFRMFTLTWDRGEDISLITALVESCSHTLEYLDIGCYPLGTLIWYLRSYQ